MRAEITRLRLQSIAPPVNVSHSESPPPTGGSFQETNDE
jgi:hypothetical protein